MKIKLPDAPTRVELWWRRQILRQLRLGTGADRTHADGRRRNEQYGGIGNVDFRERPGFGILMPMGEVFHHPAMDITAIPIFAPPLTSLASLTC